MQTQMTMLSCEHKKIDRYCECHQHTKSVFDCHLIFWSRALGCRCGGVLKFAAHHVISRQFVPTNVPSPSGHNFFRAKKLSRQHPLTALRCSF